MRSDPQTEDGYKRRKILKGAATVPAVPHLDPDSLQLEEVGINEQSIDIQSTETNITTLDISLQDVHDLPTGSLCREYPYFISSSDEYIVPDYNSVTTRFEGSSTVVKYDGYNSFSRQTELEFTGVPVAGGINNSNIVVSGNLLTNIRLEIGSGDVLTLIVGGQSYRVREREQVVSSEVEIGLQPTGSMEYSRTSTETMDINIKNIGEKRIVYSNSDRVIFPRESEPGRSLLSVVSSRIDGDWQTARISDQTNREVEIMKYENHNLISFRGVNQ